PTPQGEQPVNPGGCQRRASQFGSHVILAVRLVVKSCYLPQYLAALFRRRQGGPKSFQNAHLLPFAEAWPYLSHSGGRGGRLLRGGRQLAHEAMGLVASRRRAQPGLLLPRRADCVRAVA